MKPGARLQAAIDILAEIIGHHRPAALALADWGRTHRFAGSGDRAAIGNIVFDALRRRASLAALMGDDTPRALALGVLAHVWNEPAEAIAGMCDGNAHAPHPLDAAEKAALAAVLPADAPAWVRGDYPQWLHGELETAFGDRAALQGAGLAQRAPIDLRVNLLKANRGKVLMSLHKFGAAPTPFSPIGVRIPPRKKGAKAPNVEAEAAHGKGWFEVQDEGSQLAALLAGAQPGLQVADICAGAGGKTLALAAQMENRGQIYAYDGERMRLRPIFERLKRSGARNVQVLPAGEPQSLDALTGKMDIVFADVPCSGSGAWRRRPESKWRLSQKALAQRIETQREVLRLGARLVKPGGRLLYVTCSVLPSENSAQIDRFLDEHKAFSPQPYGDLWRESIGSEVPPSADGRTQTLLLTPASHGTDGFFIAALERVT